MRKRLFLEHEIRRRALRGKSFLQRAFLFSKTEVVKIEVIKALLMHRKRKT
jgi:hypothetical protein